MNPFQPLSTSEQLAEHLRQEILNRNLSGKMPGIRALIRDLGVNSTAVIMAVRKLEAEGLVTHQGDRRTRTIQIPKSLSAQGIHLTYLPYSEEDIHTHYVFEMLGSLRKKGFSVSTASKSLCELDHNSMRLAKLVDKTKSNGWLIQSGSKEILGWFANQEVPAFAIFGGTSAPLPSVGPDKIEFIKEITQHLYQIGHRRIVMLSNSDRHASIISKPEQAFLDQLDALGIQTGRYNLPIWDLSQEGIRECLDGLLKHTPPTAILADTPTLAYATLLQYANRGLSAPKDYSLVCLDRDESFQWCSPSISHITWSSRPLIRRVLSWANNLATGTKDERRSLFKVEFVEGETIGPTKAMK